MNVYTTYPTNEELQNLASQKFIDDPQEIPQFLALIDDGDTLEVRRGSWPAAFSWAMLLLVFIGCSFFLFQIGRHLLLFNGWMIGLLATILSAGIVSLGNQMLYGWYQKVGRKIYFILDRTAGTLTLTRFNQTLSRGMIQEVIEVHGFHRGLGIEGNKVSYCYEVSVLIETPTAVLERHWVLVSFSAKQVAQVARELAEVFTVPHRRLIENYWLGHWQSTTLNQVRD